MNGKGNGAVDRAAAEGRAQGLDTGWAVFSYLIGGMIAYGAIGWMIGRAVHVALLFPLGMLVGMAISIAYIIHRFGRQGHGQGQGRGGLGTGFPPKGAAKGSGGRVPPRPGGTGGVVPPGIKEMSGDR